MLCFQVLYVMELLQNQEEGRAYFSSISEFLLTHPVLSFGIQVVSRCRLRHTEVLPAEEESDSLSTGEQRGAASQPLFPRKVWGLLPGDTAGIY